MYVSKNTNQNSKYFCKENFLKIFTVIVFKIHTRNYNHILDLDLIVRNKCSW